MTNALKKNQPPKVGDKVVFGDRYGEHGGFKPGDVVTVTGIGSRPGEHGGYVVAFEGNKENNSGWGYEWFDYYSPKVLASLRHDTSREYADKARSRKLLTPEHNDILHRAAAGEEVDVVEFRKAATSALSAATTRHGQSMGRRQWAKEARHLIYWADAIIDQHVKGLPVYEAGARSPRIAELEAEVARLTNEGSPKVQRALRDATSAIDALQRQVVSIRESHKRATDAFAQERERRQAQYTDLLEAEKARDILASVLLYVQTQSTDREFIARVLGYWDGLEDA